MTTTDLLGTIQSFDPNHDLPLHAQVRGALRQLARDHFSPGDRFFSEPTLIQRLGVSQATVRRALGDLVHEEVLIRKPSKGTFITDRKPVQQKKLGVVLPHFSSPGFDLFVDLMSKWCRANNRKLELIFVYQEDETDLHAMENIAWGPLEGDIILLNIPPTATWQIWERLSLDGFLTINIGAELPGFPGSYVGIDIPAAVKMGLTHLAELGHKRVALLANEPLSHPNVRKFCDMFRKHALEMGFEYYPLFDCETRMWEDSFDTAYKKVNQVDWKKEGITGVFSVSDTGAWAMLRHCAENNIRIPQEISVLGYGNDHGNKVVVPPLSTIDSAVSATLSAALEIIEKRTQPATVSHIAPSLVLRASTGLAPLENNISGS